MSKVTIQGNASGTGTFTIAAPNSNTDRTFNLPDSSGTVLASDSITVDDTTPLAIKTTNTLGSSFTGTTAGEGLEVSQTNYTAGNYVSLLEGKYSSSHASPHVRIGAMYDGGGSHLLLGTSSNYTSGITQAGIEIDEDGRVTKPIQPSFEGNLGSSNQTTGATTTLMTFSANKHAVGSDFDGTTGNHKFTAPVAGRYLFTFTTLMNTLTGTGNYARVFFRKNGATWLDVLGDNGTYGAYQRLSFSIIVNAAANDYFQMYGNGANSSAYFYTGYTRWAGYFLG